MIGQSVLKRMAAVMLAAGCALTIAVASPADGKAAAQDVFAHVQFRNLGPAIAGGRVTAVAGIPGNP